MNRTLSICTNISPPQRGGAVLAPLSERWAEIARQLPRRARPSGRLPISPSEAQIEETLLAIFLLNTGNPGPQRKTDFVPIHSPLDPPNFTVSTFIEGCSCFDPGRSNTAADFLQSISTTNIVVLTDGSVPSPLGAGGAGIHAACRRCLSQLALSPLASQLSPLHWYMAWNGVTPI